jgi:lipopolysaccharide transport system ATP-binding protein
VEPIIKVDGVSKRYRVGEGKSYGTLRESIVNRLQAPFRSLDRSRGEPHFWALRGVGFEVHLGEVLGLIGNNGAGKSTLLKILSRITRPTTGLIELRGRVGSLLEVGTGFHPELTGRDNIFLNGSILGMRRAEIVSKFDEIVNFSGVEKFIDTPVKRYSSGMYVRLAFAVAAHLQPEILLIDEVLAVGDAEFQKKCLGKMGEVARAGRTIVFISHNMTAIEALCDRCVLLKGGIIEASGPTNEVIRGYMASMVQRNSGTVSLVSHPGRRAGSVQSMTSVTLSSEGKQPIPAVPMGSPLSFNVSFEHEKPFSPVLGVVVKSSRGVPILPINNKFIGGYQFAQDVRRGTISCHIDVLALMPGSYSVDLWFGDRHNDFDIVFDAISFEVYAADVFGTGQIPPLGFGDMYTQASFTLTT